MPSHPAAPAQRRQRRAFATIALVLVTGIGIAFFATGTMLPPSERGEPTPHDPPRSTPLSGAVVRDTVLTASEPVRSEQAMPQPEPMPNPVAATPEKPTAPLASARAGKKKANARSPFGRFTLVGDADAAPGRSFGESVAIEGDLAVIGAPGYTQAAVQCGAAYVYERREGTWTQTQRLDSPQPGIQGFGRRVAIVAGAIVVLGKGGSDVDTYTRQGGEWRRTHEMQLPQAMHWDAIGRGDTLAVVVRGAVLLWRRVDDEWQPAGQIAAPADRAAVDFGVWLSLDGSSLAVHSRDPRGMLPGVATYVFHRDGATFAGTPDATFELPRTPWAHGTLALGGTALLQTSDPLLLTIDERSQAGWSRTTARGTRTAVIGPLNGSRSLAGDGPLVVAVELDPHGFAVFQHRDDGWYRTAVAAPGWSRITGFGIWHPHLALSGRTVIAATIWAEKQSGRAWIFDIEDDDLARATKVEPIAR